MILATQDSPDYVNEMTQAARISQGIQMDWDDYKYFSAVAATRSVRAAAEQLDVNPSTVSRRLEHFEQRLGCSYSPARRGLPSPRRGRSYRPGQRNCADLGNIEGKLIGQTNGCRGWCGGNS